MEKGSFRPNNVVFSGNQGNSLSTLPKANTKEFEKRMLDQITFDGAIEIANDWREATNGSHISKEEYSNLYSAGYVSHTASEVEDIFHDWQDYQIVSQSYYIEPDTRNENEWTAVEGLWQEAKIGLIPPQFFIHSEGYKVEGSNSSSKKLSRHRLTSGSATAKVVLQRYYRYVLTDYILNKGTESGEEVSEDRKINIAMGFTVMTGKPLTSLIGAIKNSRPETTEAEILEAAEDLGVYDYIYPKSREKHLKTLVEVARPKPYKPEYSSNFPEELLSYEADETYFDLKRTQLVVGRVAIKEAMRAGRNISPLTELLINDGGIIQSQADRHRFKEWTKEDCLLYGKWLLKQLQGRDRFTYFTLERASRLRLGLGINGISNRFDNSLNNFYSELHISKKNIRGAYGHFSYGDMVRHVQVVGEANAGKVSERLIREYYQEYKDKGINVPSPAIIQKVCGAQIGEVIESAGYKVKRKADAEACVSGAVRFYDENGRFPCVADIIEAPYLHSWPTIRRYCGNINGLTEMAKQALTDRAEFEKSSQNLAA